MATSYSVAVDTADDLSYSTDLSAAVLEMQWRLGMAQSYDLITAPSKAQITLVNIDRVWSPEYMPNVLTIGRRVRIQAQSDGALMPTTLFTGLIRSVKPVPGELGERITRLELGGPESEYHQVTVLMPLQVSVTPDEVLDRVFDSHPLERFATDFETGISVLSYIGDLWGDGITAQRAIREVVEAERGRCFYNRDGVVVFWNRHHLLRSTDFAALFADDMAGMTYEYGAQIINNVRVRVRPRAVGIAGTVLWRLEAAQMIRPGAEGEREIIGRFYDASGQRIGALAITTPEAYTDYTANTSREGSGTDVTTDLSISAELISGGAVKLTLHNHTDDILYLMEGARVRGTPVYPGDSVLVQRANVIAQEINGIQTLTLSLPALDSIEEASQLAVFELARRETPCGAVLTLTLDERNRFDEALALTLFDRVRIEEAQTGHAADYFIVAEAHEVSRGGFRHRVIWTLEAVPPLTYWILDESSFDSGTRLAY